MRRPRRPRWPPAPLVRFGALRRMEPVSDVWGFDRGLPIDRYYVEDWLRRHTGGHEYAAGDITGRVLEVGGDEYARRFGKSVERIDVLHENDGNPGATVVGDLTRPETLPEAAFDCVLCIQTLHVIYDARAALEGLHRLLRPGGVLLATVPGITRGCTPDRDLWGDWWRYTTASARRQVEEVFGAGAATVDAYGNLMAATGFLHGLAAEELRRGELDLRDPLYEIIIGVRATRSALPER